MNPEPQILPLPAEPTEAPQPNAFTPAPPPSFTHRGNGKIARLPKPLRDQVNNWLLDGLSYPDIIERLGEQGKELKPGHLYEYKKRGHQVWLRQREWFEHVTASSEFAKDLLAAPDTTALHEAGLRMAAAQINDQLMRFSATADAENAPPDPEHFARLVNALSRLTREALAFRKYHDAIAKAQAAEPTYFDPGQKPSQKAQDILLNGWRNFFRHDLTQPMPDVAQTSSSAGSAGVPPAPPTPKPDSPVHGGEDSSSEASQAEARPQPPQEHCLECRAPLLALRPDPSPHCHQCDTPLPSPEPAAPSPTIANVPAIANSTT